MELKDLFGLPAHPLVVHAAVVLLPLAALATVVIAALPRHRRTLGPIALGLALVATISVGLAQGSGEALADRVKETRLVEEHTEQGETVLPWAIAVSAAAALVVAAPFVLDRRPETPARTVTPVLVAVALITGVGAVWSVAAVGHSGAKATWNDVANQQAD